MKTSRRLHLFAPCLAVVLAGCCVPVSKHPLSDEQTSVVDQRLVGIWEFDSQTEDGEPERFVIRRLRDLSGWKTTLEIVPPIGAAAEEQHPIKLYCTKIGGRSYLTWTEFVENEASGDWHYMIARYDLGERGQEFRIQFMDCESTANEIKAGRLKGEIKYEDVPAKEPLPENVNNLDPNPAPPPSLPTPIGDPQSVVITSSTAELQTYFAKYPDACFPTDGSWRLVARQFGHEP